jgi:hypothetical protein
MSHPDFLPDEPIFKSSNAPSPIVARDVAPTTPEMLWRWIYAFTGIQVARARVCPEHNTPWDYVQALYFDRPSLALVLGSRGSGKSFLSALDTHLTSRWHPKHATRILGGSRAQSEQVYRALSDIVTGGHGPIGSDAQTIVKLLKGEAEYANGSEVAILAASSRSVRGPHVPSLKLDEVDEIDPEFREAAMGMCMERHGVRASVVMTSTWHRVGGPMTGLIERAKNGEFPLFSFCAFDVLEHCPDERSGKHLENCSACSLQKFCHDVHDGGPPKAKRAHGHYAIDALIQKLHSTSMRTFEADYLCRGPKTDGLWFPGFDGPAQTSERAEYDPSLPVHLSVDSGVFTGAVFFQIAKTSTLDGIHDEVRIFADYLAENRTAEMNARALLDLARTLCNGKLETVSTDPAGGARNPVGPTVMAEYERAGLRPLRRWPVGSIADGLALMESFIQPADGRARLILHPRCQALARAIGNYRRARRGGQWQDYPEDPQHPHEDLVDALRGGLRVCFPEGRVVQPSFQRIPARQVF